MDYEEFLKNNDKFESWCNKIDYDTIDFYNDSKKDKPFHLNSPFMSNPLKGADSDDVLVFADFSLECYKHRCLSISYVCGLRITLSKMQRKLVGI
jgi:hypothetical protein